MTTLMDGNNAATARKHRLLLVLLHCAAAAAVVAAQAKREPVPFQAATLNDLKPVEPEQRIRAEHFQFPGRSILQYKTIRVLPEPEILVRPFENEVTPTELLRRKVCKGSAVVVGQPLTSRPFLNKAETFLFTDFSVFVERWIRGPGGNAPILVSMIGGRATVAQSTQLDASLGYLLEVGKRYVLFLDLIPKTRSYQPVSYPMVVSGTKVRTETVSGLGATELKDHDSFMDEMAKLGNECKGA